MISTAMRPRSPAFLRSARVTSNFLASISAAAGRTSFVANSAAVVAICCCSSVKSSGVKTLADVKGRSFAYADPASTSGHLFPAFGLSKNGIDPDKGEIGAGIVAEDRLPNNAMLPGDEVPMLVQTGCEPVQIHRTICVHADILFARPQQLHWRVSADGLRNFHGL